MISKVTDYIISYLREENLTAVQVARETGIAKQKLTEGYVHPLDADEFLRLCVYLHLRPEDISRAIREKENE